MALLLFGQLKEAIRGFHIKTVDVFAAKVVRSHTKINILIGAAAVKLDSEGRILLVKHSYGKNNWELPGVNLKE